MTGWRDTVVSLSSRYEAPVARTSAPLRARSINSVRLDAERTLGPSPIGDVLAELALSRVTGEQGAKRGCGARACPQHLVHAVAAADEGNEIARDKALLIHVLLDHLHGIRK